MNREGKRYISYKRVSTEMQVDGFSLEGQNNRIIRFGEREEMVCVGEYEDAGKSGKSIEGRPDFKRMLADIENGLEVDYVLVYKLSRFGRNAADILNSLALIQSYGVELICVEEGIDSSQTSGKLLISVLSAVAEIERENILEQTMNGRKEKARQGGWNGGPAPYGYSLKDNKLIIDEKESEIIKTIYHKFLYENIGYSGIAKYLNLQGVDKNPRKSTQTLWWSAHFVKIILDNPVYCGKIAFGRRTREKVKGTRNEYRTVFADDYILCNGKHEAIIDEEMWQKAQEKRKKTGIKPVSRIGRDRVHLLTGLIRCPKCGGLMYCNRTTWKNKDGSYHDVYYYYCGNSKADRGHLCDYRAKLRKTDIEPYVVEAIKDLVRDEQFAQAIQEKIGVKVDTSKIDEEIKKYELKLKEIDLNKVRLENEMDCMPIDAKFRERKLHDMSLRLDSLYETMVDLEELIEDAKLRKQGIEMESISLENIYEILRTFEEIYDIMDDKEQKTLITYLIKEIQINPNDQNDCVMPLKSIEFNFPLYKGGKEVRKIFWETQSSVESVVCLTRREL